MDIIDEVTPTLHGLGLGKNDIKVYIALLEHGKGAILDIAKHSKVHRVNVYDAVRSLQSLGLVTPVSVGKRQLFQAASPSNLKSLLRQREESLDKVMPLLSHPFKETESKSQNFEGLEGIKRILEDMLISGETIQAFGIPKLMPQLLGGYLQTFHRRRIERRIHIYHIYNENAKERIAYLNKIKHSQAKYLPLITACLQRR